MYRLTILISCFYLIGCNPAPNNNPTSFEERQEQLFYKINHKLIYQSCQQLMRLQREGKLSANTFYCDNTTNKQNELPESIHSLQPTYVRVDGFMLTIAFHHNEKRMQLLRCTSNEFGEAKPRDENTKGLGFRKNPFGMDKLSGAESLDNLNEKYDHFQMELIPGLTYETYEEEQATTMEKVKKSNELMDMFMNMSKKTIGELAVKKQKLLHQTDHNDLLKACRLIITRSNDGTFSKAKINPKDDTFAKDPEHIPEIIRNFEPVHIWPRKDMVIIVLIGGLDHAGVRAYMNSKDAVLGDDEIKLIDGLIYYDDGLREVGDEYKEYLNDLREEAIPYLDWKRKKMNLPIPKR
jgi:hypothetical protein